jgi:Carboxypeptidase regulatory-like domain
MQSSSSCVRNGSRPAFLIVLVLATLSLVPALMAQAYFGTVSGELTDVTGAVVVGAKVVLTDQQKRFNFETNSDTSGRYLFRSVPPGVYSVSADSAGFSKTVEEGFNLDVNQNVTVNLTMKVAGTQQTVKVSTGALTIQTHLLRAPVRSVAPREHPSAITVPIGWITTLSIATCSSVLPISRWEMLLERWAMSEALGHSPATFLRRTVSRSASR